MRIRAVAAASAAATLAFTLVTGLPAHGAGHNELVNPGFDKGLKGWTNIGADGAASAPKTPHRGHRSLVHRSTGTWSVSTVQTLDGLDRGTYLLTAWVQNFGAASASLTSHDCGDTTQSVDIPAASSEVKVTLAVSVFGSSCTVGIASSSTGGSVVADDFTFRRIIAGKGGATMAVGGDITYRRMNAANGLVYSDAHGKKKDVLDILAPSGFNLARIRVYNQPGNTVNYGGTDYQLQPGWQDLDDAIQNVRDAKARGMKIFLSFHYSDWWTNPGIQATPAQWKDYNQAEKEKAIYDFTVQSLRKMRQAGVTPAYVSIGNEINNAIVDADRWTSEADYYATFKSASAAVRDASPQSKVAIHLTTPDTWGYNDWITKAKQYGVDYDVLGISAYPFWTTMSIASLANFAHWVGVTSGKSIMIAEIGYAWNLNPAFPGEVTSIQENNLDADGVENYGATPAGQLRYLREYMRAMNDAGHVEAISYWDPISIDPGPGADPNGWVVGGDVAVEDTSLFDYTPQHKALPGLLAFRTW